jgi:hypothetical protein
VAHSLVLSVQAHAYHSEAAPLNALEKFTGIETLILQTRTVMSFYQEGSRPDHFELDTPGDMHAFGLAVMQACSTLRQATLAARTLRSAGVERNCTLTRTPGTDTISFEEGTGFDFDAVSKFWTG